MIIKDAVTYAEDASVENFWADVVKTQDAILAEPKTEFDRLARYLNDKVCQLGIKTGNKITVKYIYTKYEFGISPTYKKSSYVEWRQAR